MVYLRLLSVILVISSSVLADDQTLAPYIVAEQTQKNSTVKLEQSYDALDEVNRTRAVKGLPPFKRDNNLTAAALAAASYRSKYFIEGHTSNDFAFLPKGSRCSAAGCAAWPMDAIWGSKWGSCCTYESWQYAGAAWAIGRDNRRYMHLYVR